MSKIVLYDFYTNWCAPCKMVKPYLHELEAEHSGIEFLYIDAEDNIELAEKFSVMSVPAIIVTIDDVEVNRKVGFQTKKQIESLFKDFI